MGKDARIILKCNSISDKDIIEKISEASCAGVSVQMIVRGICCIKAGVPGLTENVTVRSIVGRYLEHERVYAFGCGQDTRVYIDVSRWACVFRTDALRVSCCRCWICSCATM